MGALRWLLGFGWLFLWVAPVRAGVVINEYMPKPLPEGEEWVELYNDGETAQNLDGWQVDDIENAGSNPYTIREKIIGPKGYVVIYKNIGFNDGGDDVRLVDPKGQIVDKTDYKNTVVGGSFARRPNGSGSWQQSGVASPGCNNDDLTICPIYEPSPTLTPEVLPPSPTPIPSAHFAPSGQTVVYDQITLSEVYACPPTDQAEWVELFNTGDTAVDLSGLALSDSGNHLHNLSGEMAANGYWFAEVSSGWLNNDGDEVILLVPSSGQILSRMSYDRCYQGESLVLQAEEWVATTTITKGTGNVYTTPARLQPTAEPTNKPKDNSPPASPTPNTTPAPIPTPTGTEGLTALDASKSGFIRILKTLEGKTLGTNSGVATSGAYQASPTQYGPWFIIGGGLSLVAAAGVIWRRNLPLRD